jgi:nucleotide-binding universal stress UspA family protein
MLLLSFSTQKIGPRLPRNSSDLGRRTTVFAGIAANAARSGTIYAYLLPIPVWLGFRRRRTLLPASGRIMLSAENLNEIGRIVSDSDNAPPDLSSALITHVLAPTDLSDESRTVVEYAAMLAEYFHAKLTLLHVWTTPNSHSGMTGALDPEGLERSRDRAESILRNLEDTLRERYSYIQSYFLTGELCSEIITATRSSQVDLIVISTHDYDWLSRLVEGSDAEKILRHATCPVWIIRGRELVETPAMDQTRT